MTTPKLYLTETADATFVAVDGKGLRKQSEQVKSIYDDVVHAGNERKLFVVLDRCSYLDSTFLGSLVQMTKRQRGRAVVQLEIVADAATADRLFGPCNLDHYLPICDPQGVELPERWRVIESDPSSEDCAYHQLESHESLAELDIPDAPAFRQIADSLRRELRARDT